MRKITLIGAAVGAGLMTTAAFAAVHTVPGVIKSIDASKMLVTLKDGTTFEAPKGFDLKPFEAGEKVKISYDKKVKTDGHYVITAMVVAK